MFQPLLLIKQTLESEVSPLGVRLEGPNARFTRAEQVLSRHVGSTPGPLPGTIRYWRLILEFEGATPEIRFQQTGTGFSPVEWILRDANRSVAFKPGMAAEATEEAIRQLAPADRIETFLKLASDPVWSVERDRCFLAVGIRSDAGDGPFTPFLTADGMSRALRAVIHVSGNRAPDQRTYPVASVEGGITGLFHHYVGAVLQHWKATGQEKRLSDLRDDLSELDLTDRIEVQPLDDTRLEVRVGRLKKQLFALQDDLVDIADVGLGVAQVLPVLVALIHAEPGQTVYIEEPELHLHPRAQVALAGILARAAREGKRVVVETHSQHLLLAVQTLVAEKKLDPGLVALHWFERDDTGQTHINTAEMDEHGAYGDWPVDFGDVSLNLESRYLDAALGGPL